MIKGVILDLDGTVYRGGAEVPGAAQFIAWLRKQGIKYLFVTNRANRTPEEICAQLRGYGISCEDKDIITTAQVTAWHLKKGKVFFIGEEGLRRELVNAGFVITDNSPDYVIVSYDHDPSQDKITKACRLIKDGAKFVATNPDKGLPTEDGFRAGTGAIVEKVSAGTGVKPMMIGKPERLIIDLALERMGLKTSEAINVGDNVETDIPAGKNAGVRTAFILTGLSRREDLAHVPAKPDWIVENYNELAEIIRLENPR
jgi:4-nitrophenyl phosphatase